MCYEKSGCGIAENLTLLTIIHNSSRSPRLIKRSAAFFQTLPLYIKRTVIKLLPPSITQHNPDLFVCQSWECCSGPLMNSWWIYGRCSRDANAASATEPRFCLGTAIYGVPFVANNTFYCRRNDVVSPCRAGLKLSRICTLACQCRCKSWMCRCYYAKKTRGHLLRNPHKTWKKYESPQISIIETTKANFFPNDLGSESGVYQPLKIFYARILRFFYFVILGFLHIWAKIDF